MEVFFWLMVFLIFYTYAGYVIVISILSVLVPGRSRKEPIEPKVSLVIAAYNEEKRLEEKLQNCFGLDYPPGKLEIIVASDSSTDRTDAIARDYEQRSPGPAVRLFRSEGRLGKTATQNGAVRTATGEIIVFSDAASMYDHGALRALVRNYADSRVGAVSGRYLYENPRGSSVGRATKLFWALENFIKSRQSRIGTITGCCGCIYSVRKELYVELPPSVISDLVEPLAILRKGYRIAFEPEALAYEEAVEKPRDEFRMRVRVIVRGMNGLLYMRSLLNPLRYPFVALQLISHKVLRWLVPVFFLAALGANLLLVGQAGWIYRLTLGGLLAFCLLAVLGLFLERRGVVSKVLYLPMYFMIVNCASLVSLLKVIRGENIVTWQTQR